MPTKLAPGDVLAVPFPNGMFGAVRVLAIEPRSSLLVTTPYVGKASPKLTDPALRRTLVQRRFFYKGGKAIAWAAGKPPASHVHIGNVPLTAAEKKIKCNTYAGKWTEGTGQAAWLEWRWENDRDAFVAEVEAEEAKRNAERDDPKPPKAKAMMSEKDFWSIIAKLDWKKTGDDDAVLAPAVAALAKKTVKDIYAFEERLAWLLYALDTRAHASHIGEASYDPKTKYVSADEFLYVRCCVVANGKKLYDAALASPKKMPKDMEFEALLSLARDAYEKKKNDEMDYEPGVSYESFTNRAGWK